MRKFTVFAILMLALIIFLSSSLQASASSLTQGTAVPTAQADKSTSGFPYLALLVIIVPLGVIIWLKSRPGVDNTIRAASCVPVIDEAAIKRQQETIEALEKADNEKSN